MLLIFSIVQYYEDYMSLMHEFNRLLALHSITYSILLVLKWKKSIFFHNSFLLLYDI
jgi:hypothetical protein